MLRMVSIVTIIQKYKAISVKIQKGIRIMNSVFRTTANITRMVINFFKTVADAINVVIANLKAIALVMLVIFIIDVLPINVFSVLAFILKTILF